MIEGNRTSDRATAPRLQSAVSLLGRVAAGALATLLRWQEISSQRRALREMDQHRLDDIGISRADALREGCRPFWDEAEGDPRHWR